MHNLSSRYGIQVLVRAVKQLTTLVRNFKRCLQSSVITGVWYTTALPVQSHAR